MNVKDAIEHRRSIRRYTAEPVASETVMEILEAVLKHRPPAHRRRMKTLIQELISVPARILSGSGQLKLDLGCDLPGREAYLALHHQLAAPLPRGSGTCI